MVGSPILFYKSLLMLLLKTEGIKVPKEMQSKTTNTSYRFAFFYVITADFRICHTVSALMCRFPQFLYR